MKKKFFTLVILSLSLMSFTGFAQFFPFPVTTDALTFSQTREGYATARASAMGGAMASLGGDISSLSYNPAGLGMYRNSEFVFVPQILSVKTNATYQGVNNTNSALAKFNASVGGVAYFGNNFSKNKFSIGFVYNRLANFNSQYEINASNQPSMDTNYAAQLRDLNEPASTFLNNNYRWGNNPMYTPAILALRSGMVDTLDPTNPISYGSKMNGNVQTNTIMNTSGYIDEYAFSGGYSYDDRLFLGLTIGLQNLYYYQSMDYFEADVDNNQAQQINELSQTGFGVNIKVGAAYKVTDNFRLGFAFHTPTFYSLRQNYSVTTFYNNGDDLSPIYRNNFNFNTPWKFIVGASYNILKRLTISADYQATLYNSARFKNYTDASVLNNSIKSGYKNGNSVRIGLEWNALQWKGAYNTNFLFLRGGYNYVESPYTKSTGLNDLERYNTYTAGIGYKGGIFFADFAFLYTSAKNLPWNMPNGYGVDGLSLANTNINPKTRTMNFLLTIGFRF